MGLEFSKDELRVIAEVFLNFRNNGLHRIMSCSDIAILSNVIYKIDSYWDTLDN